MTTTTKSTRRLGMTATWISAVAKAASNATGTATATRRAPGYVEPMSKRAQLKDGAAVAWSTSSTSFCCAKCLRSADCVDGLAETALVVGKCLTEPSDHSNHDHDRAPTPPTTLDKLKPTKSRNRSQPTSALFMAAMHRKSKSKSKSQTAPHYKIKSKFKSKSRSMANSTKVKLATQLNRHTHPELTAAAQKDNGIGVRINISNKKKANLVRYKMLVPLPTLGATSFVTLLTILCIETVLLSTMSSCAKTFYMHWNTSNSIFRIDNTDHIIDVNKGNLAFEFDQVHIICPVYEPGAFENETEKYIIYNVSKVEYETCRITNADPRVIAICDKPQKLMFFTITFRPFTPQPGGLEFLPGNDYYFISTSSKDDLYRRIGGRCSTNNMKVVFKVCCAAEEKNKTTETTLLGSGAGESGIGSVGNGVDKGGADLNLSGHNGVNTIGLSGGNAGFSPGGAAAGGGGNGNGNVNVNMNGNGIQLKPINGMGTSINTNIDQFNRIPIQPNIIGNNIGAAGGAMGASGSSGSTGGIMLSPGHGSINMLPPGRGGGGHMAYPGHHHIQTGIRINNVPTQPNNPHTHHKGNMNTNSNDDHGYDKHPNEVVKNEELTYNSGSVRLWSWPGSGTKCAYGIDLTVLLPIAMAIVFDCLLGRRLHPENR